MLVTGTLPLVVLALSLFTQFVLPRILLVHMSPAEYTVYVAVAAISGYVGLSDGGMRMPVLQELASLHAAGDRPRFLAATRRAAKLYTATSIVGVLATGAVALTSLSALAREWSSATSTTFTLAVLAVIVSEGAATATAPVHDGLLSCTGRMNANQLAWFAMGIGRLGGFLIPLVTLRDLGSALFGQAFATTAISIARALHTVLLYRVEAQGERPSEGLRSLGAVALDGLILRAAEVFPVSMLPHVLSISAPALVPFVVPCRTYANGCRMLNQQFVYLLQVHITRRAAGDAESNARGQREYEASASLMVGAHLLLVGAAAAAAEFVFELWLPGLGMSPRLFLGALLAEQALQAIVLPGSALAIAHRRIREWGQLQLVGACASLVVYFAVAPYYPRWAYGAALFVLSLPRAARVIAWEINDNYRCARLRAVAVGVAVLLALALQLGPLAVGIGIAVTGCATLLVGVQQLRRL